MEIKSEDRWFSTIHTDTLCRMGGNGPMAITQIMPILKYVQDGDSFLDVGCGSGATIDTLKILKKQVKYKGIDFIDKHVNWLKEHYPGYEFEVQDARDLKEPDNSWDIVWSRHLIDHLDDFEKPMESQCRIAKKLVICILWMNLSHQDYHEIKPIIGGSKDNRITYPDEWTNQYSRKLVNEFLEKKKSQGWALMEFKENCLWDVSRNDKGNDTIIVLQRL